MFTDVLKKFFTNRHNSGTNRQQPENRSRPMFIELKSAFQRSSATLAGDMAGAVALGLLLVIGLHLPNLF
jgi:hypothetical protein